LREHLMGGASLPLIPFGDQEGRLSLADRDLLWAVMAYPRDERLRHELMARLKLLAIIPVEQEMLLGAGDDPEARRTAVLTTGATLAHWLQPHGGFAALSAAPALNEVLEGMFSKVWPASIAGDILCYLLQMEISGISPSVNKGIAIVVDYLRGATTAAGRLGPRSERYIRAAWEDFKPVSHFWLAYRIWQFDDESIDHRLGPEWFSPLDVESLRTFLALAELLANQVQPRPQGRRRSPINPADFWRVPSTIELPQDISFERPGLEDWALEVLRRYRRRA